MAAAFYKHRILLDENFYIRSYLPQLNERFTVRHILHDLKHEGWSDRQVFQFTAKNEMILVTFNAKDFLDFVQLSQATGLVGVSTNLNEEDIDKKLTALFTKSTKRSLLGKVTHLTGESKVN